MVMRPWWKTKDDEETTTKKRWWNNGGEEKETKLGRWNESEEYIARAREKSKEGIETNRKGQKAVHEYKVRNGRFKRHFNGQRATQKY